MRCLQVPVSPMATGSGLLSYESNPSATAMSSQDTTANRGNFRRTKRLMLSVSLVAALSTTMVGCPIVDVLYALFAGLYLEFSPECGYDDRNDYDAVVTSCLFEVGPGDALVECIFECAIGWKNGANKTERTAAGDLVFFANDNKRVLQAIPSGSVTEVLDIGSIPMGIALDASGGRVYWVNGKTNEIWSGLTNGTSSSSTGISGTGAIDVGFGTVSGMLYWTTGPVGKIQKSNPDGSSMADVVTGLSGPGPIVVDETGGKIYWADHTNTGSEIMRSNLDGTSTETLQSVSGAVVGLALDPSSGKVYFTDTTNGDLLRMNFDGSSLETILTGLSGPASIGIDATNGKVYWYNSTSLEIKQSNLDGTSIVTIAGFSPAADFAIDPANGHVFYTGWIEGSVKRMNLDGTGTFFLFSPAQMRGEFAVDAIRENIYWFTTTGLLLRTSFDGTVTDTLASSIFSVNAADFDAANDKLYFASGSSVYSADLDGSNIQTVLSGITFLSEIAVDGASGYLFWIENQTIGRANLDGSGSSTFANVPTYPHELAAADGYIYWTTGSVIRRADQTNPATATDLISGLASPFMLDVSGTHVYWDLVFTDEVQRALLDGTGIESITTGSNITTLVAAYSATLPVELESFRSVAMGNSAVLKWRTSSERNVSGFEVERVDQSTGEWSTAGFEAASGGLQQSAEYSFTIADLAPGMQVFRLRIVDVDGSSTVGPESALLIPLTEPVRIGAPYPNPFRSEATLSVASEVGGELRVEVYDAMGRRVKVVHSGSIAAQREKTFTLDGSDLGAGTYFVRFTLPDGQTRNETIVKLGS